MNILTSVRMALRNIKGNKTRAFLTMLGMIIGVSSVIVLVCIGQGSSKAVANQINSLGSNLITVQITDASTPFTKDNLNAIKKLNDVKSVSPILSGRVMLKYGKTTSQVQLTGTNPDYESERNLSVESGRFLSDIDLSYRQKVAVLGNTTAQTLFGTASPVGKSILVNGNSYKVVGVLNAKGGSMGQNQDDMIIVPFSTSQRLLKTTNISQFYVQADNANVLNAAMFQIQRNLYQVFHGSTDSYSVFNQQEVLNTVSSVSNTLSMLLAGIASISLLVGGIGIMNIMFVSVTERTKEIGIRKAIGAKRKDILGQFLIEAVVLSSIGGIIGVALGLAATKIYSVATGTTVAYSMPIVITAFLFSVAVGIVFGVFPASKASKLHPIQALRFE